MEKTASITFIFIGKDDKYYRIITDIAQTSNTKCLRAEKPILASNCIDANNVPLFIIDTGDDSDLRDALRFLNDRKPENRISLLLVNGKCEKTELLSLCEKGEVDYLTKPIIKELFTGRVKHLFNEIKFKLSLDQEVANRKALLSSLLDEERYAESLINSSMDMIISVDLKRNIFEFNKRAQETFGYTKEEIIGKPVDLLYADKNQSLSVYQHTLEEHQYSAEITNRRKNGELFPSLISASILVERGGKTLGLMGVSRDISDFKRVEAELKRAKEEAEKANRAKSEFLTNMSHEIRTPMTSVIGYAELLEDGLIGNPELLEFVRSVKRNGQHLLHLINEILDLSQVEKGKLALNHVYCSPQNIMTNLYHITNGKSKEKGLSLSVNYIGRIPKFIHSDPTRILQCLVNLVGNAIKFTPTGGSISVSIECLKDDEEPVLCFQVTDTGIGIPANQLKIIMEPFEQGNIPNEISSQGVGLGLSITRRLANLLGGSVSVKSQHGNGSTFTLTVKCGLSANELELTDVVKIDDAIPEINVDSDERENELPMVLNGKILLAEDNPDISKLVTKILKDAGAIVDAVDAGTYVLTKVPTGQYDLIFMDMQLPLMDGMTVVKKLRESGFDRPIVALTASAMDERLTAFIDGGCNDCAVKPIGRYDLVKLAHKWLKGRDRDTIRSQFSTKSKIEDTTNNLADLIDKKIRNSAEGGNGFNGDIQNFIYSSYHSDPEMQEIVKDYVNTLPIKLDNIDRAFERDDLPALRKIVHDLHGSGGGFGFDILSKYGGEIEKMIDQGRDKKVIATSLDELHEVIDRIMGSYRR